MPPEILQTFERVFDTVLDLIISNERAKGLPAYVLQRLDHLIRYTVKPKIEIRGATVPLVYMTLLPDSSQENLELACVLGLCWQLITAAAGTIDDYYEKTERRYGKPTWTSLQNHTDIVVNDALVLQNFGWEILKIYFVENRAYSILFDTLNQFTKDFFMGEYLEMLRETKENGIDGCSNLKSLSMEMYEVQVKLLNGQAFEAPVKLACALANDKGTKEDWWVNSVNSICSGLASIWTFIDDYKDIFQEKSGCSDIRNGKITWLIIKAVETCSAKQLNLLESHYGNKNDNPENAKIVVGIFEQLGISKLAQQQQTSMVDQLRKQIDEFGKRGQKLSNYFSKILDMILCYEK